ncbi:PQQ-binding-like beta-propeller repeat protein [Planctomicrobium sp. SH661]|uniref:PQQ-binding-like beta-propeller repeat protein n=1 Tax=Planctomicrobium sp. SH661 TaxID=3448124 RepID=UPI003F5B9ACB
MPRSACSLLTAFLFSMATHLVTGADPQSLSWPDRGGPTCDGHAAASDSVGLPTTWDEATGENIAWKVPLPEFGHSTPVIGDGKIWMTTATEDGTRQSLLCLDEMTGKTLHHQLLFENESPEPLNNKVNTYASPSCVLEPDALYVHFGSYGTARIDPRTLKVIWQRRDIECRHFRGPGSSPAIFQDLLILTFDGIDHQFLIALNKHTGETVWRTSRSTDYGDLDENGMPRGEGDYRKAYSTPSLKEVDGRMQLLSTGSRAAFSYDPLTGEELWTITHDDFNASSRPLFHDGHTIINTGSGNANLVCVDLNSTTRGNVDKTHVLWNREKGNSDLSSPILIGDRVYMVTGNGVAVCINADTGDEVWKARIGGTFVASPVTANGLIYFCNEEGVTAVIEAGDEFKEVAKNTLSEGMRSSPAIAHGALFLRTFGHLYKIASRP